MRSATIATLLVSLCLFGDDARGQALREGLTPVYRQPNAPELALTDIDGNRYDLASMRDNVVVVNFWATWCPPCLAEMPSIQNMWEKLHGDGLEVLAVNVGEDSEAITQFLAEFETSIEFPVLLDEKGEAFQQWRVLGLPQTFVIDKKGRMIYEASGGRDMDSDHIRDRLVGLLKE